VTEQVGADFSRLLLLTNLWILRWQRWITRKTLSRCADRRYRRSSGIDEAMMGNRCYSRALNPIETLFVVDAMLGQDAVNTAKAFNDACH
jgi:steroid 5-alpha reductase family enzyme